MIDLHNPIDLSRLYRAVRWSYDDALRPFRRERMTFIQESVGSHYSANGASLPVYVNLMNQVASVYTVALAANRPQVKISVQDRRLVPFANRYEVAINNLIAEMHLDDTLQKIVLDAFFSIGVAKVFLGPGAQIELYNDVWVDVGKPYIDRVSLDDLILDMSVKDLRKIRYAGNIYRVPWSMVQKNPDFDGEVVKNLYPVTKQGGGWDARAQDIATGSKVDDDEYEPMTELFDLWLPELGVVAIFSWDVRDQPPLAVIPWNGPEGGPYHFLCFADVPDNVMPSAPAQNLRNLHDLSNGLFRKQAKQARRQKVNVLYSPSAEGDADRLRKAEDGEYIRSQDPAATKQISIGGVDPANVLYFQTCMQLFDRMSGNLQAMAGLGPQAPTLGQEELIHQTVNRNEAKLVQRTYSFVAGLAKDLGHLLWVDENLVVPGTTEINGTHHDADWTPEMREGDFYQYNFDVEPYSMAYESPEMKVGKIDRVMASLVPAYPLIQAGGGRINLEPLVEFYAKALRIPELKDMVTFSGVAMPPPGMEGPGEPSEPGPGQGGSPGPATTTRQYVRRNVAAGGSPQAQAGQTAELFASLARAGANGQRVPTGVGA